MAQLHFYVSDEEEQFLRAQAEQTGTPLSRYLAQLVQRAAHQADTWPPGYFEAVFGQWDGESLVRPRQGHFDDRIELE